MSEQQLMEKLNFSVESKRLIDTLKVVGGVIENTQVIPILSHVKLEVSNGFLTAVASDSEIEMTATIELEECCNQSFTTAVSCKKLSEICKTLQPQSLVTINLDNGWLCVESQQSKFMLATLAATNFPRLGFDGDATTWTISSNNLQELLQSTAFAMAEQDIRFFLNGLHLNVEKDFIHVAATDGHRLASAEFSSQFSGSCQCIMPRKAVLTLLRLLHGLEEEITIKQTKSHIQISCSQFSMTSNLLEGSKIDCQQLIPSKINANKVEIPHIKLKQALSRAAILSHEKFRGVRVSFSDNCMHIQANNAKQEKIEETIPLVYENDEFSMAFNINYIQEMLNALSEEVLTWFFLPEHGTVLVEENVSDKKFIYVVMSMNL